VRRSPLAYLVIVTVDVWVGYAVQDLQQAGDLAFQVSETRWGFDEYDVATQGLTSHLNRTDFGGDSGLPRVSWSRDTENQATVSV
jgi:hypothetical protein